MYATPKSCEMKSDPSVLNSTSFKVLLAPMIIHTGKGIAMINILIRKVLLYKALVTTKQPIVKK